MNLDNVVYSEYGNVYLTVMKNKTATMFFSLQKN